jgi:hypothetical protein
VGLIRKIQSLNQNGKIQALGDDDSACLVRRHSDSRLHLDRPSSFFKSGRADWLRTTLVDPYFFSWAATHYVIEHIEDHFWKLECKLNNEMELEERLEQLKEKRLRVESEITKLTELYGSRGTAIEVFYLNQANKQ